MAASGLTGSISTTHSTSIVWEIPGYFDLRQEDDGVLISPTFYSVENECRLHMYIFGKDDPSHPGWISLQFYKQDRCRMKEGLTRICMGIVKPDGTKFRNWSDESTFGKGVFCWRKDELVKRIDLIRSRIFIAPEGVLRVFCTLIDDQNQKNSIATVERTLTGQEALSQNFSELFLDESLSDIVIRVEEELFPSHRAVLAARSPVFQAMLKHDTKEKSCGAIEICDCSPIVFSEFLQYLYSGKPQHISLRHVYDIYQLADKYDVKPLKILCVACITDDLNVNNFCDVILLAKKHGESELVGAASNFFVENAKNILPTEKWQNFMAENLAMANELFLRTVNK